MSLYNLIEKQYKQEHKCCPKCNSISYGATTAIYRITEENINNYEDRNKCICLTCGHKHIIHDRVKKKK